MNQTNMVSAKTQHWVAIIGTRPEAIKLSSIVHESKNYSHIRVSIFQSGQQPKLTQEMLAGFNLSAQKTGEDFSKKATLTEKFNACYLQVIRLLEEEKPDGIFVQGDTTTAFAASLAAFYLNIPIAHIEAGLRTFHSQDPYPEEFHRASISQMATWHFCPTENNAKNLKQAGITKHVYVVGNTVIDAAKLAANQSISIHNAKLATLINKNIPFVFITAHRRENWLHLDRLIQHLNTLHLKYPHLHLLIVKHPNAKLESQLNSSSVKHANIHLVNPLNYNDCIKALQHCKLILTDSGGLQEEASLFNTPILVLRKTTERLESLAKHAVLSPIEQPDLLDEIETLLSAPCENKPDSPYGDGQSGKKILAHLFFKPSDT